MTVSRLWLWLLCLALPSLSPAQRTYSFGLGGGTAYYYGDLSDRFAARLLRPAVTLSGSAYLMPTLSLRISFTQGWVGGADSLATDNGRRLRDLHFRSPVTEGSALFVWEIFRDRRFGRRYLKKPHLSPYAFGGLAIFRFNPQAQHAGTWHDLQPLGTEGQQSDQGSYNLPYGLLQMSFPFGVGAELRFASNLGVRAELGYRYTLTDYLDDVSTAYPNPDHLAGNPLAQTLSNRNPDVFAPGDKRGSPAAKDSYIFVTAALVYYLSPYQR